MQNTSKIKFGFLIFVLTLTSTSFGQAFKSPKVKYGDVSKDLLLVKNYAKDTAAPAVVLHRSNNISYSVAGSKGLSLDNIVHCRIQIFKKSAFNLADVIVPYSKNESFRNFKAVTYNLVNNEIVKDKLEKENVFDENYTDGQRVKKFTFQNVKEGSIIEYSYSLDSPYAASIDTWDFQREIPVAWSEIKAIIPDFILFKTHTSGYLPFDIIDRGSGTIPSGMEELGSTTNTFHFGVKDAPAIKPEPFIATTKNFTSSVSFEFTGTNFKYGYTNEFSGGWKSIAKTLGNDDDFGLQIKKSSFVDEAVESIKPKVTLTDTAEVFKQVCNYVKGKIRWNKNNGMYPSEPIKKIFEKGEGNPADINFFVLNILNGLGFEANPVVLSTRENGWVIEFLPNLKKLNYMVAGVKNADGTMTYLDATEKYLKAGMLPERCLNGIGLMVFKKSERYELHPLWTKERESSFTTLNLKMNEDGELEGECKVSGGGLFAASLKETVMKEGQSKYSELYKKSHPTWEITKLDLVNMDDLEAVPELNCTFKVSDATQAVNDKIYFKPLLEFGEEENPFKEEKRQFAIDFAKPFEQTIVANFDIPAGYVVEAMPKNALMSMPEGAGKFTFSSRVKENKISISSRVLIKNSQFQVESYPILKEFYNQIVAKHAEQIVLKKGQ